MFVLRTRRGVLHAVCLTISRVIVPRATFSIDDPWLVPEGVERHRLRRAQDGEATRLATTVALWWDTQHLNALFSGDDDGVVATYMNHDDPLYEEDVVELFLAPNDATRYFEIEVNPLGTVFDAIIESPDGVRATMSADVSWTCTGLFAAVKRTPLQIDTLVRVPFASIDANARAGDRWRANFFRIDRHPDRGDEFAAWSPTMKTPADFHVAKAFGELIFA